MIFLRCFALMLFSLLEIQARVCSGWYARLGQFPSVVSIHRHRVFCNGAIVHLRFVVSAAHCFDDMKEYDQYTVVAGVLKMPTAESVQQVRRVIDVKIHDKYNNTSKAYDHVLLRADCPISNFTPNESQHTNSFIGFGFQLDKPFVKTKRVYPLPVGFPNANGVTNCQTAVWGVNRKNQQYTLKYINVKKMDNKICSAAYPNRHSWYWFCVGATGGVDDMCQGYSNDSLVCTGGPLICNGQLSGIISSGENFGKEGHYAIYDEIPRWWIQTSIKERDQLCGKLFRSGTLGTYPGLTLPIYITLHVFNFN